MNDRKETIILFVFIVIFIAAVFLLCSGRTSVYDLRIRADSVRGELDDARESQQRESETIERASEAAGRSTEAVKDSERTNKEIAGIEQGDAEIIGECRNILRAVRERGREEN